MPKIGSCKIFGRPNFKGGSQHTHISTINMYRFIKIRHDIIKQCHGNYRELKKFNYKLEIDIFRNSAQIFFRCPEGFLLRVWVSKKAPRRPAG